MLSASRSLRGRPGPRRLAGRFGASGRLGLQGRVYARGLLVGHSTDDMRRVAAEHITREGARAGYWSIG
jgi:hypothetical protein